MRYDSEHKARTRDVILTEASRAIRSDGPDRMGVAALMARAGLTHGGFYAHFASKDELVAASIAHMFAERYDAFFASIDTVEPRDALRRFINNYLSMVHRDTRSLGCPLPILSGELDRITPASRERYEAGLQRLIDALALLLAKIGVSSAEAKLRSTSTLAHMVGAICISRALSDPGEAEAILLETRRVAMIALVGSEA